MRDQRATNTDLPASYVVFPKARTYVASRHLLRYVGEVLAARRSKTPWREVLRALWNPRLRRALPPDLAELSGIARELGLDVFQVRYPTDGGRYQVTEVSGRRIAKVAKPSAVLDTMPVELEARDRCPDLAPRLLGVTRAGNALVEERLGLHTAGYSLDVLAGVLERLCACLYRRQDAGLNRHCAGLSPMRAFGEPSSGGLPANRIEAVLQTAARVLGQDLPVSRVHGDLTVENLVVDAEGSVRLIDWEYARACIVTYDGWHYIHQHHMNSRAAREDPFYRDFTSILPLYGMPEERDYALALHVVHLLERISFLQRYFAATTDVIRETLRQDLRTAGRALLRRGAGRLGGAR